MKDLFPGHFKENEKLLKEVWSTSIFVFDANILLNLYRYSDQTQVEFLRILKKIKQRAYLPHRAAEEYLNNRLNVINQQEKSYEDTFNSIGSLKKDLENSRQHPFVSDAIMEKVRKVFEELCKELQKNKSVHTNRMTNDEIKDQLANIFEKTTSKPYDIEKLKQLVLEGRERYIQKIPPGFKDESKSADDAIFSELCRKYGDFIVWSQVIDMSVETGKGVIFVTDDKKEDWWEIFKGKTIGPHPDLIKEFKQKTDNTFHMYQADRFLELARENLNENVSEEIVNEIRDVRRRDKEMSERYDNFRKFNSRIYPLHDLKNKMDQLERERMALEIRLNELSSLQNEILSHASFSSEEKKYSKENFDTFNNFANLTRETTSITNALKEIEYKQKELQLFSQTLNNDSKAN